jgi:hypothetical protein
MNISRPASLKFGDIRLAEFYRRAAADPKHAVKLRDSATGDEFTANGAGVQITPFRGPVTFSEFEEPYDPDSVFIQGERDLMGPDGKPREYKVEGYDYSWAAVNRDQDAIVKGVDFAD